MKLIRIATPAVLLLALAGCAGTTQAASTPSVSASQTLSAGPCTDVTVVVNYGTLKVPSFTSCARAGVALDVLKAAGVKTEGTADYGDQVVCRVDNHPDPAVESCAKLPSAAYWALWVKTSPDAKWAYAEEGVSAQQLTAGESVGLVYTVGTDSTPPEG